MAVTIADTAIVDPSVELEDGVEIGPYCVIGRDVTIGRGTCLLSHVVVMHGTRIGRGNVISPFVVLGGDPQDLSYKGTDTRLIVGDGNTIREGVTMHRGTEKEEGITRVGNNNFFMAYSHVAHDCNLENNISLANAVLLAGHVHVESYAGVSGGVAVHHFVTIGRYSFVGGQSRIFHDVPRFMLVDGNPSKVRCINIVGLKRRGIPHESIEALHEAHRLIYRARMSASDAKKILDAHGQSCPEVDDLFDFINLQQSGRYGRARERFRKKPLPTLESESLAG